MLERWVVHRKFAHPCSICLSKFTSQKLLAIPLLEKNEQFGTKIAFFLPMRVFAFVPFPFSKPCKFCMARHVWTMFCATKTNFVFFLHMARANPCTVQNVGKFRPFVAGAVFIQDTGQGKIRMRFWFRMMMARLTAVTCYLKDQL